MVGVVVAVEVALVVGEVVPVLVGVVDGLVDALVVTVVDCEEVALLVTVVLGEVDGVVLCDDVGLVVAVLVCDEVSVSNSKNSNPPFDVLTAKTRAVRALLPGVAPRLLPGAIANALTSDSIAIGQEITSQPL